MSCNNTTMGYCDLEAHRKELFRPVIGYIGCLLVIGAIGNIIVLIIYARHASHSTKTSTFYMIISLAVLDLSMCIVCMPFEITFMIFYNFEYPVVCKLAVFICLYINFASMTMLIIIALDRYRKVNKPLNPITIKETKIQIGIGMVVSLIPAWPAILVYGTSEKYIPEYAVTTTQCGSDASLADTIWPRVYHASVGSLHIVVLMVIIVIYSLLRRRVRQQNKVMTRRHRGSVSSSSSGDINTERMTRIFFTLSLVFVLSYVPTLLLVILRAHWSDFDNYPTLAAEVAYQIFRRSYFINNAINPMIYCFLNPRFRTECGTLFRDVFRCCTCGICERCHMTCQKMGDITDVKLRKNKVNVTV